MPKINTTVSIDVELFQFMTSKGIKLSGLIRDTLSRIMEQEKSRTVEMQESGKVISLAAHLDSALRYMESINQMDNYEAWKLEQVKKEEIEPAISD